MAHLEFAPRAAAELGDIHDFIARDDPEAAHRWVLHIEDQCRLLASQPRMGAVRSRYGVRVRVWPVRDYLILYRESRGGIRVAHVISARRDIRNILRRRQ